MTYSVSVLFVNLQIEAEIQHFQAKSLQKKKDHDSLLADIEEKQAKFQSQAEEYEKQAGMIDKLLENVKTGVGKMVLVVCILEYLSVFLILKYVCWVFLSCN